MPQEDQLPLPQFPNHGGPDQIRAPCQNRLPKHLRGHLDQPGLDQTIPCGFLRVHPPGDPPEHHRHLPLKHHYRDRPHPPALLFGHLRLQLRPPKQPPQETPCRPHLQPQVRSGRPQTQLQEDPLCGVWVWGQSVGELSRLENESCGG